jgi:hypothetical protein
VTVGFHQSTKNQKNPSITKDHHHLLLKGHGTEGQGVGGGPSALIGIPGIGQGHVAGIGIPGGDLGVETGDQEVETEDHDRPAEADGGQDTPGHRAETGIGLKGILSLEVSFIPLNFQSNGVKPL